MPDIDTIRRTFTSLSRTGADGRPLVFLDGPGGAQVPDVVIDAMADYLRHSNANIDGAFVTSAETTELVDSTRVAAADFLGSKPEEVIFGPNMTTINFNLVHAFCRTLEPGDEIVVTALDHDANVSPWLLCAEDHGLVVRTADVRDGDLQVEPAALEAVVGPRTKVVRVHARLERDRHDARGPRPRRRRALRRARSPGWTACTTRRTAASM